MPCVYSTGSISCHSNFCLVQVFCSYHCFHNSLHKKWGFLLRISSVNVAKSAENCQRKLRIWNHLLKKSLMENFIFVLWFSMIIETDGSWNALLWKVKVIDYVTDYFDNCRIKKTQMEIVFFIYLYICLFIHLLIYFDSQNLLNFVNISNMFSKF